MTRRTLIAAAAMSPMSVTAETTVADAIANAGVAASWAYVTGQAEKSAGWLLIARRAAFAECLADTCRDMGLQTVAQVEAFVARCGLSYAEVQALFPAVTLSAGPEVVATELYVQSGVQFSLTRQRDGDPADFEFMHFDASYKTMSVSDAAALAAAFPWRSAMLASKKQCEHMVSLFKGWCVQQGYADRAIGFAGLDLYNIGRHVLAHAVPFIYTDDRKFLLVDNGKVFPAGHSKFVGCPQNITYAKLRLLQI